jgi:hypothetical protein
VRPPPDPAALYREGTGSFELVAPLPDELASVSWPALDRRNRFNVLVAAWALREAEGIRHLNDGRLDQASQLFQECLIRAEYLQTPELVARSYENLADMMAAGGNDYGAQHWRAEAAKAMAGLP